MKTKELIAQLQEADPEGELEVISNGSAVFYVERLPAYYDGRLEVFIKDPKKAPYYDVVGAKIVCSGEKVRITTLSLEDAIYNNPDLPVEFEEPNNDYYKEGVENLRKEARLFKDSLDYMRSIQKK